MQASANITVLPPYPVSLPAPVVTNGASFQTGRYVHEIRFWDNAIAYDGSVPSWAHRLRAAGHRVESIAEAFIAMCVWISSRNSAAISSRRRHPLSFRRHSPMRPRYHR